MLRVSVSMLKQPVKSFFVDLERGEGLRTELWANLTYYQTPKLME
jgi:hypothetical protein